MKNIIILVAPILILASCGDGKQGGTTVKRDSTETQNVINVSVQEVQPVDFKAYIEVQSQIDGDENVVAGSRAPGTVQNILVQAGQRVSKGQVLATLDAETVEQQIAALGPQLELQKSVYEKQKDLWAQDIGTEVQLMTTKANYEATQKQIEALKSQKDLYRIVSPISGVVDAVDVKIGEPASPGMNGIRVVNYDKLKAEATLGENYLGKVQTGDPVTLILPDINDTVEAKLAYVSQAVDPVSRAFTVQIRLGQNPKMHPNMSCIMRIANYENAHALVVPVSVIQKTMQGTVLYVAAGNKSKSVLVTTGRNANGQVEILSGLNAGDKVIVRGYEELDNGQQIDIR